jgi:hypothetical protein
MSASQQVYPNSRIRTFGHRYFAKVCWLRGSVRAAVGAVA